MVVTLDEIVCRRKHSYVVLTADVALESQHTDLGILVNESFERTRLARISARKLTIRKGLALINRKIAGRVVRGIHQPERVLTTSAGEFGRDVGIDDSPGVND